VSPLVRGKLLGDVVNVGSPLDPRDERSLRHPRSVILSQRFASGRPGRSLPREQVRYLARLCRNGQSRSALPGYFRRQLVPLFLRWRAMKVAMPVVGQFCCESLFPLLTKIFLSCRGAPIRIAAFSAAAYR
jgi:hypothetical protein